MRARRSPKRASEISTMYNGNLFGSSPLVWALWHYALAHAGFPPAPCTTDPGDSVYVEIYPGFVRKIFGDVPESEIMAAIRVLTEPDPDYSGRRRLTPVTHENLTDDLDHELFRPTLYRLDDFESKWTVHGKLERMRQASALRQKRYRERRSAS